MKKLFSKNPFENVGNAFKTTAKWFFWMDFVIFAVGGLIGIFILMFEEPIFLLLLFVFPIYVILCVLLSYSINASIYAFGELVDGATASRALAPVVIKHISDIEQKEASEKERIKELQSLLKSGLITQEEYEIKVAK